VVHAAVAAALQAAAQEAAAQDAVVLQRRYLNLRLYIVMHGFWKYTFVDIAQPS